MSVIFGPDTFTVGANANIDAYPTGTPDYAYSRGSGANIQVNAANDYCTETGDNINSVARCINAAVSASMADQEARADIRSNTTGPGLAGLVVRYSTTTRGYMLILDTTQASEVQIYESNAGDTLLASADRGLVTNTTYAATLSAREPGPVKLSAQVGTAGPLEFVDATTPVETGAPGMYLYRFDGTAGTHFVDNFAVDNLVQEVVAVTPNYRDFPKVKLQPSRSQGRVI